MSENTSHVKSLSNLFLEVLQQLNITNNPEWLELDLTFQQMKVLYILRQHGSQKMSELHKKLHVTMPTITGIVNRLVERKDGAPLLSRETSPDDRREVRARLTTRGFEVTEMLNELNNKLLESSVAQLETSDAQALETHLTHFLEVLTAQRLQTEKAEASNGGENGGSNGHKARRTRSISSKEAQAAAVVDGELVGQANGRRYVSYTDRPVSA